MYQAIQDFGNYKVGDIVPDKDIIEGYVVRVADKADIKPTTSNANPITIPN